MVKNLLLIFSLSLIFLPVFAQSGSETEEHPIDAELRECMEKDYSTMGMMQCLGIAYDQWDAALNKNYQLLRGIMTDEQKEALKQSQLSWITFRDKEFANMNAIYDAMDGTMWRVMHSGDRVEFIKRRALELQGYYDLMMDEY